MQKSNNPIGRVRCVVDTCEFYENGNYCMAEAIEIQPHNAQDSQETDCSTFKRRH